jgi:hypothetical protein
MSPEDQVEGWAEGYAETGDAFYVWWAYAACRRAKIAIPSWVLECFDRVAIGLQEVGWETPCRSCRAMQERVSGRGPREFAVTVADALELTRVYAGPRLQAENLAERVFFSLVRGTHTKVYLAIEAVAKEADVSRETARRAWKRSPWSREDPARFHIVQGDHRPAE